MMMGLRLKYKHFPVQVKASIWFLLCSFIQKAISVLTTPVFTRLLSTAEYGQIGVFQSWYGIAIVIVPVCLSAGMHTQGLVKFSDEKDLFTSSLQGLVLLLVLIWSVVYLLFSSFWNHLMGLTTIQVISMLVMTWTFSVVGFWSNEQRVGYRYRRLVVYTILVSIAKPVVGIILVLYCKDKVTARITGMAGVGLVFSFWMFIEQVRKGKKLYSRKYWRYGLLFNLPLLLHYLSSTVLTGADRIMIENMVGYSEAGIYSLAYSVGLVMMLFNSALTQTMAPWIYQKIKGKQIGDIAPIAYSSFLIVAMVNLVLILFAPEAVAIFAPASYMKAIYAIPPVAMSAFFMHCYTLFSQFEFYYERTLQITAASVGAALLNIVLNYICIPRFGYVAAGYTTLVCYMAYGLCHYVFMNRACRQNGVGTEGTQSLPFEGRKIMAICVPFLLLGLGLMTTYRIPGVRYGIGIALAMAGFAFRKQIMQTAGSFLELRKIQDFNGGREANE